jgi:hypothetical protein
LVISHCIKGARAKIRINREKVRAKTEEKNQKVRAKFSEKDKKSGQRKVWLK